MVPVLRKSSINCTSCAFFCCTLPGAPVFLGGEPGVSARPPHGCVDIWLEGVALGP